MISRRWTLRALLFSAVLLFSFAPAGFPAGRGIGSSGAQCETCCTQTEASCIVCGTKSCVESTNYYMAKVGSPCSGQIAPNIPG
jgi:hypothetical protein